MTKRNITTAAGVSFLVLSLPFVSGGCDTDNRFLREFLPELSNGLATVVSGLINAAIGSIGSDADDADNPPGDSGTLTGTSAMGLAFPPVASRRAAARVRGLAPPA